MADPNTVKTSQTFILDGVIYNSQGFSIGVGRLMGAETFVLAMRWNGREDHMGFPYAGKHSLWFTLPKDLSYSILLGLLHSKDIPQENYAMVLNYMKEYEL